MTESIDFTKEMAAFTAPDRLSDMLVMEVAGIEPACLWKKSWASTCIAFYLNSLTRLQKAESG